MRAIERNPKLKERCRMLFVSLLVLTTVACRRTDPELVRRLDDQEKRIKALEEKLSGSEGRLTLRATAPPPRMREIRGESPAPTPAPAPVETPPVGGTPSASDRLDNANKKLAIRAACAQQFGSDWQKLDECERTESNAFDTLLKGNTYGVPSDVYGEIRGRCAERWGEQYAMQLSCQQVQAENFKQTDKPAATKAP